MNLTSAAIEAAAKAVHDEFCRDPYHAGHIGTACYDYKYEARTILEAAAPHMCIDRYSQRTEWPDIPRSQASRHSTPGLNPGVTLCLECIKDACTEHSPNLYGPNPYRR